MPDSSLGIPQVNDLLLEEWDRILEEEESRELEREYGDALREAHSEE